ncbi:MAG: hypothetical protein PHH70_04510 [Candidatus Gracilibacteria bacterium]|nr:hypothetical protein [Candidatus Gracilibacteria bacterium]
MIPSYKEEIRIRKNKDRVFWFVVAVMTVFLYFFFQGYYPNYERFFSKTDTSKQAFLKPFGIIDIHVFPSPDSIWINNEYYNNNSKTIFDLGPYSVSIQKKGYLSVNFLLDINRKNPFYTNVVNLFALPKYSSLPVHFDQIFPYGDLSLIHTTGTGGFLLVDTNFDSIQKIQTTYSFVGGTYFTDGKNIFTYSRDTGKFLNAIDAKTGLPLQCDNVSYYGEKLFCHDTLHFIGPKTSDISENIIAINERVIMTSKYIYNQDTSNTNWKYFEYQTGTLSLPNAVVHIGKLPYALEDGILSPLDTTNAPLSVPSQRNWGMDSIDYAQEFDGEAVILGKNLGKVQFQILDGEKKHVGVFDFTDTKNVNIYKVNGAYVFTTPKAAYISYKGAKEIIKILDDVDVIRMMDAKIFFNKDGKSSVIDLLRKETK